MNHNLDLAKKFIRMELYTLQTIWTAMRDRYISCSLEESFLKITRYEPYKLTNNKKRWIFYQERVLGRPWFHQQQANCE
jgi:hypothetical protein